jgi:methionyl-tRNA synthetase
MSKPKFYVTTPIYYVNAPPHMGTAYTTVIADVLARSKRMLGYEACLVTGSDEHSQNIADKAREQGLTPKEFCEKLIPEFSKAWDLVDIGPYKFCQTSSPEHRTVVQALFQKIYDKGDIYKKNYSGYYHTTDNRFVDPDELPPDPENHPHLKFLTEEAYWFRLSSYQDWLLSYHESNPTAIVPDFRRNEMLNRIKGGLRDLCISRSSTDWGIPLPWDAEHVFYVWVDALVTYLTGSNYRIDQPEQNADNFWPCDMHIMAKDIPWFHTIIWPAMLHAAGLPVAKQCVVHGYWNFDGTKMSKSKGNVFHPADAVALVGSDAVRYFLLREVKFGLDGNFSVRGLAERYNYDLANDFGNLLHRALTMGNRFTGGTISAYTGTHPELETLRFNVVSQACERIQRLEFKEAVESIWDLVRALNRLIDDEKPWELNKTPENRQRLLDCFAILFRSIRTLLILLAPVMPKACQAYWEQCGQSGLVQDQAWGDQFSHDFSGEATLQSPQIVFAKLDLANIEDEFIQRKQQLTGEVLELVAASTEATPTKATKSSTKEKPMSEAVKETPEKVENVEIGYEDFAKVHLITVKVVNAEAVPGSDKLIRLTVDDGKVQDRTIVSGIRAHFTPEEMIGQTICIVDNLKPRKIFGIMSQGMILAAGDGEVLRLVTPKGELKAGVRLG